MVPRPRHRAVAPPGGGHHGPRAGRPRHPGHPHGLGQVDGCPRHALPRLVPGLEVILHSPHQSPGQREVLLPVRRLRQRKRRHDHGRHLHQPRRHDHLLHGRDFGERRPARRRGRRHRLCRHGRVPLLRRQRPRLGLAGAASDPAEHEVPTHERHAGRHERHRRQA